MKKEYKFPIYSPVVPPQVAFQLVYADGSKSMSFTPDQWEAETYHNTQKVVGWVPTRAEITFTPEDGKWYLCEFVNGKRSVYLYKDDCWLSHTDDPPRHTAISLEKSIKVIAEMKEVAL